MSENYALSILLEKWGTAFLSDMQQPRSTQNPINMSKPSLTIQTFTWWPPFWSHSVAKLDSDSNQAIMNKAKTQNY